MTRQPEPTVAVAAGLVWLALGLGLGLLVLLLEPFGSSSGDPRDTPDWAIWNGYLVGLAPLLAVHRAYRDVRAVPYSPRGMEERRTIGGRWMLPTCAIHASGPAGAWVWSEHPEVWGPIATAVLGLSWLLFVEVQRRTRVPLPFDAWTNRELDQLRVNTEVLFVTGVWCGAGMAIGVVAPDSLTGIGPWVIGLTAIGVAFAFARVVATLCLRLVPVGLLAVGFLLAAIWLAATADQGVWLTFLVAGVPLMVVLVERARRRRQRTVAEGLDAAGFGPQLCDRYGTEFVSSVAL